MTGKILSIGLPISILFLLYRVGLFEPADVERITQNRILVSVQQCTCPELYVEKGGEQLKDALGPKQEFIPYAVFSEGRIPFEHISFPEVFDSKYILEGHVIRTQSIAGNEIYPVFRVHRWIAVEKAVLIWSREGLWSAGLGFVWMATIVSMALAKTKRRNRT